MISVDISGMQIPYMVYNTNVQCMNCSIKNESPLTVVEFCRKTSVRKIRK